MEIQFLGTGAAEGIPPLFSRSAFAQQVREEEGPDLRSRSALRLGDEHQIDFGPDHFFQAIRCKCDFFDLRHLLVTHMHSDHFQLEAVMAKEMPDDTNGQEIQIYASVPGIRWLEQVFSLLVEPGYSSGVAYKKLRERYPLVAMEYYSSYKLGELHVHTVKGNHRGATPEEFSINPLISLADGRRFLYAVDTGYYSEESWEFLSDHRLDLLIMEATFGGRDDRPEYPDGHLDGRSFVRVLERMLSIGLISEDTPVYATHINPDQGWNHNQLQAFFRETNFDITVAHDCLRINL